MNVHQSFEAAATKSTSKAALCLSLSSKENLSPCVTGSPSFTRTPSKIRPPLRSNSVIGNQPESVPGKGVLNLMNSLSSDDAEFADLGDIDSEIESIEKEIGRLTSRLEYLRFQKLKRISAKSAAALKRGRFVPAKFMDPTGKTNPRKIDESKIAKQKTPTARKAISLGPAEIYSATKSRKPPNRPEITPFNQSQSRRKSCFWKLQEVDEHKVMKERGKTSLSMTLSPKLQEMAGKLQADDSKKAVTTLRGSKCRSVKKEDEAIASSIQPKELFKDGDRSEAGKKPLRCGRVVASRYMCSNGDSATPNGSRKRCLPDNDESKTFNRKRISLSVNPEIE